MSANSTVTCFRSSSNSALDLKMLSARRPSVWPLGESRRGLVTGFNGHPHSGQNLAVDEAKVPQLSHDFPRGAAHSSQNFAPTVFSCWQLAHFIFGYREPPRIMQS